jgi:hypothetical protein
MARRNPKTRWYVIVALLLFSRFFAPLLVLCFCFYLMTCISEPLFNLLLRFNKFGRYALTRQQTLGANVFGVFLLLIVVPGIVAAAAWNPRPAAIAIWAALMLVPVSVVLATQERGRSILIGGLIVIGLGGLAIATAVICTGTMSEALAGFAGLFVLGCILLTVLPQKRRPGS